MKKLLLVVFATLLTLNASAQRKVVFDVDVSYLYGLQEKTEFYKYPRGDWNMYGKSLRFTALYRFSDVVAAGVGIGLDGYLNPGFNTCPLFLKVNCSPIKSCRNLYVFEDLGRNISGENFNNGTMLDFGVGYKLKLKKIFGINFKIGYKAAFSEGKNLLNLQEIIEYQCISWDDMNHTRRSLFAGIGIEF